MLKKTHDVDYYVQKFKELARDDLESIFTQGHLLLQAKEDLPHGQFQSMIRTKLPFGKDTAEKLMKIARNPLLTKSESTRTLPARYETLYHLTKLPETKLSSYLKDGTIQPSITMREALKLVKPKAKEPKLPELPVFVKRLTRSYEELPSDTLTIKTASLIRVLKEGGLIDPIDLKPLINAMKGAVSKLQKTIGELESLSPRKSTTSKMLAKQE